MTPRARLWLAFALGLVATIAGYAVWLGPLEAVLTARGHGIVALELAFTEARFAQIVRDWGEVGRAAAIEQVWWDFVWIPAYCLTLWSALRLAGAPTSLWTRRAAAGVLLAGACDVVENIGLLRALSASSTGVVVPVISLMATVKFALLLVAAGVLVASLLMRLLARRRRVSDPGAG